MIDLDELERLHKAATEGEWRVTGVMSGHQGDIFVPTAERIPDCHQIARCFADKPKKRPLSDLEAIGQSREAIMQIEANAASIVALHNAAPELIAAARERDALRVERDFLLARAGHAGSCSFAPGRWTGSSSNALVTVAFGGEDDALPYDTSDLAACYRTMLRLPRHLLSEKVWQQLEAGERFVGEHHDIAFARDAAGWTDEARAALKETSHDH